MLTRGLDSADEHGFTLVELLVVIVILGVIGAVVVASVAQSLRVTTETTERTQALTDLERGVERVTRQIRVADPLRIDPDGACDLLSVTRCEEEILQRRLDADTYSDGQLVRYSYYLVETSDDVELRQDISTVDIESNAVTSSATGEFIAQIANVQEDIPLFRFFAPNPVTGVVEPLSCDASGTVEDCRNTYATASVVEMTLSKVLTDREPLTVSTVVEIRNTRYEP